MIKTLIPDNLRSVKTVPTVYSVLTYTGIYGHMEVKGETFYTLFQNVLLHESRRTLFQYYSLEKKKRWDISDKCYWVLRLRIYYVIEVRGQRVTD